MTPLASEPTGGERLQVVARHSQPLEARLTITVDEAAELLGVSRSTAYSLVRQGQLPSLRLGRRIVVPVRRLLAVLDGGPAARGDDIGHYATALRPLRRPALRADD